ncbi:unnamed protein product [Dicrocoelium dendriticum]|nr:unnamed protein product [Dicrocoelium dendriticum]
MIRRPSFCDTEVKQSHEANALKSVYPLKNLKQNDQAEEPVHGTDPKNLVDPEDGNRIFAMHVGPDEVSYREMQHLQYQGTK